MNNQLIHISMINVKAFALYFHIYEKLEKAYRDGGIKDAHQTIILESPNIKKYADYFLGFILR